LEEELEVTVKELKRKMDTRANIHLIDVREPHEFNLCRIEGSELIPLGEIPRRMKEFGRDEEYVLYCHTGNRSGEAAKYLRKLGFKKAKSLKGGINQWAIEIDPSVPRY
jgi:adenylyltransferase/sulfurtransferase